MWVDCDLVRAKLALLWAKQQLGCMFGNLGKFNPGPCKGKVLVAVAGTRSWRWSGTSQDLSLVKNQRIQGLWPHQEGCEH